MAKELAVGIDLGTTNSCIAIVRDNAPHACVNNQNENVTPSCVSYSLESIKVGCTAMNARGTEPMNTFYEVKRLMGRKASDPVTSTINWPFQVVQDDNGFAKLKTSYHDELYPEEISASILAELKKFAEKNNNGIATTAVITVPSNFNQFQRQATKDAGKIAGFEKVHIVNEPTAAAIAYGHLDSKNNGKRTVLVYDFGGGTFDVSVVELEGLQSTVLSTCGDTNLGGAIFDQFISEFFLGENQEALEGCTHDRWKLLRDCEAAKKELTSETCATIAIDAKRADGSSIREAMDITRDIFNEMIYSSVQQTISYVDKALSDVGLKVDDVHEVVLVGGSSRIPLVERCLSDMFTKAKMRRNIHADLAIAYGAAILAENYHQSPEKKKKMLRDVTPFSLGVASRNDKFEVFIPRLTPIPCALTRTFQNYEDNQTEILIKVYEGESTKCSENYFLGETEISITKKPQGKNKIEETFSVSEDGTLKITAKDNSSELKAALTVQNKNRRSRQVSAMRESMVERQRRMERESEKKLIRAEISSHARTLKSHGNKKEATELEQWLKTNPPLARLLQKKVELNLGRKDD